MTLILQSRPKRFRTAVAVAVATTPMVAVEAVAALVTGLVQELAGQEVAEAALGSLDLRALALVVIDKLTEFSVCTHAGIAVF